jgi:DNA (cytosine-5)-methyltransferase 1
VGTHATQGVAHPVAFDTTQITSPANYSNPQPGDPCHPLAAGAHVPAVALPLDPYLGGEVTISIDASYAKGCGGTSVAERPVVVHAIGLDEEQNARVEGFGTLKARMEGGGFEGTVMTPAMQVRRLTPVECERLQGFPDHYTAIPWRNKPADQCPDGPRYKALGNSWAVPVVRWIGNRINQGVK